MSGLPEGWIIAKDEAGDEYFFNTITGESSWDPPSSIPIPTIEVAPVIEEAPPIPTKKAAPPPPPGEPPTRLILPENWIEAKDDEGTIYYFNTATGQSSWDPPSGSQRGKSSSQDPPPRPDAPKMKERPVSTTGQMLTSSEGLLKAKFAAKGLTRTLTKAAMNANKSIRSRIGSVEPEPVTATPQWKAETSRMDVSWPDSRTTGQVTRGPTPNIPDHLIKKPHSLPTSPISSPISSPVARPSAKSSMPVLPKKPMGMSDPPPSHSDDMGPALQTAGRSRSRSRSVGSLKCPACQEDIGGLVMRFCPHCGVKMDDFEEKHHQTKEEPTPIIPRSQALPTPIPKLPEKRIENLTSSSPSNLAPIPAKPIPVVPKKVPPPPPPKKSIPPSPVHAASLPSIPTKPSTSTSTSTPEISKSEGSMPKLNRVASVTNFVNASPEDFESFMKSQGLDDKLIQQLKSQKVTLDNMTLLTEEDLKELGVTVWGDRKTVMLAIKAWDDRIPLRNSIIMETPSLKEAPRTTATNVIPIARNSKETQSQPTLPTAPRRTSAAPQVEVQVENKPAVVGWAATSMPNIKVNTEEAEKKRKEEEKKKADERRAREKAAAKQEEEYFKNKGTTQHLSNMKDKKMREEQFQNSIDPATCEAELTLTKHNTAMKGSKPHYSTFTIEIYYAGVTWSINRRYKQFVEMDMAFRNQIRGYTDMLPKTSSEEKKRKFDKTFLDQRLIVLSQYIQVVNQSRTAVFASQKASFAFCKFLAPIQYGDVKGPDFMLPFKVDLFEKRK